MDPKKGSADAQILVLNSGSSSLKFQLISMPSEKRLCQGLAERLGAGNALLRYQVGDQTRERELGDAGHREALNAIVELLRDPENTLVGADDTLTGIGHRVVHGGTRFSTTTVVDQQVKDAIRDLSRLAPLHNPANLQGIELAEECFPGVPQVAVFDTAFHSSIPPKARRYAIPADLYQESGIQLYGFHGTSHKYVSEKLRTVAGPQERLISLHLGNGCSATAILSGKSIDHSLGFTPSNGLVMGSRSGDIDHGMIFYLVESLGYPLEKVAHILNRESGLKGLTGFSDLRDVENRAAEGDPECQLALEMSAYRIRKYIGAYTAAMNGLDALVFTAGIGENAPAMRERVCRDMEAFGISLDQERNTAPGPGVQALHAGTSEVGIWVVPTDEELEIARQAFAVL